MKATPEAKTSSDTSCPTTGSSGSVPGKKRNAAAAKLSLDAKPDVKKSTESTKLKICHKWKDEFPWLIVREEDQAVLCSVCCDAPHVAGKTQFLTGCTSTKKETMQKHAASNGHLQVNSQFRKLDYVTLWQTLLTKVPYKEDFKDILHLVGILLVLPISAAQCERAVSAQNRIKSSTRAMLGVSVLEDLICISSEGPPVADFDPAPAVARWFSRDKSKGERSRRPHFLNN